MSCLSFQSKDDPRIWMSFDDNKLQLYRPVRETIKSVPTKSRNRPWDIAVTKIGRYSVQRLWREGFLVYIIFHRCVGVEKIFALPLEFLWGKSHEICNLCSPYPKDASYQFALGLLLVSFKFHLMHWSKISKPACSLLPVSPATCVSKLHTHR